MNWSYHILQFSKKKKYELPPMYVSLSKCCTKYVKSPIVYLHFEGGTGNIKFLSFMSFLESQISKHFMI